MQEHGGLWELRKFLGTMPQEDSVESTEFYSGVDNIFVDLVPGSYTQNPYRALFTMATATWGGVWDMGRWEEVSPEARFAVVNAVLSFKTLPNAMEVPTFMFEIAGPSRSSFDQVARARIGAVFGSMGWRDNNHANIGFRVPDSIAADPDRLASFKSVCHHAKYQYIRTLETGQSNWQDARAFLPISACHRYTFGINFMALRSFCSKRCQFNEQADTVATAWLMRYQVEQVFPLLASYLRPASDHARRCTEHVGDEFAQAFGNLFRCSGRWPCDQAGAEYTFNESCSDRQTMMSQLGIYIPEGREELPGHYTFKSLSLSDRLLFEEN